METHRELVELEGPLEVGPGGTSREIAEVVGALGRAQAKYTPVARRGKNPHFGSRYAELADVAAMLRGPFAEEGLTYWQRFYQNPERPEWITVSTVIAHSSGQWIRSELAMRIVPKMKREDQQALLQKGTPLSVMITMHDIAGAITYARRQALLALAGVVAEGEDDDGNAGSGIEREKKGGKSQASSTERQAFLEANPGLEAALKVDDPKIRDIAERFAKFGSISERQVGLVMARSRAILEADRTIAAAAPPPPVKVATPPGLAAFRPSMAEGKRMLELLSMLGVESYRERVRGEDGPRHVVLPFPLARACGFEVKDGGPDSVNLLDIVPSELAEPAWRLFMHGLELEAVRLAAVAADDDPKEELF